MKKILSVALSTAMAFSMFASVAFGADAQLTPEQKFNALKEAGIVSGFPDGLSHLEKTLTRAELAKIIVNSLNLEPVTGVATYKDKGYSASHWAAPYIEAATAAGILNGKDATKKLFDPNGAVTVQELAKVLVTALKLEVPADANNTASEWAKGYVAAAVKAGYIAEGINYQAAATRSQATVAAYAIYEASQVPTVKSYKVVDPKNVEVTMSNGDVVKVALETALEANKETEIKFTYQDKEYTTKVTYVTTVAQGISKVTADNLKVVVVSFDGTVDETSATAKDNYSVDGKKIDKVTLSEDKSSVTILLDSAESNTLKNQKEVELKVKNVKNSDGTKTFDQTVKFTPVDVTAPTVKEVVGLGTKAFKIKFSEPIRSAAAVISSNFKVDGKAIGASVKYAYPDTVIVSTNLTEGEHKVSVSNVEDFSGLKVAPVDNDFTVAVDTAAPEIVSVTANDLKEVTVTFNETIKSVDEAYANVSSRKATAVEIKDNQVVLRFDNTNEPLNYGENTIYLKGVSDYSDNKTDREAKVTPTLDTIRPTVVGQELKTDGGFYKLVISFSESLNEGKAEDRGNYVLKNSDGKVADKAGVNGSGNPVYQPEYNDQDKTVTVNLGSVGSLDDNTDYILTVSGLTDNAYVANTILPVDVKFNTSAVAVGTIDRVWAENISGDESFVFVQFNRDVKTEGVGSALEPEKYTLKTSGATLTTDKNDITIITGNTVRITTKDSTIFQADGVTLKDNTLVVSYVADSEGKYFVSGGKYNVESTIKTSASDILELKKAEATSKKEVVLEFSGKLSNVNKSDFEVTDGTSTFTPQSYKLSNNNKTLTLTFADDVIPANANTASIRTTANVTTQDEFGNKVNIPVKPLDDQIRPSLKFLSIGAPSTATGSTYFDLTFAADEPIQLSSNVTPAYAASLFKVKFNEVEAKATTDATAFNLDTDNKTITIRVYVTDGSIATNGVVTVIFDGAKNDSAGALVDLGNKNKAVDKLDAWKNY